MRRGWCADAARALIALETTGPVLPAVCAWEIRTKLDRDCVEFVEVHGQLATRADNETSRRSLEFIANALGGDLDEYPMGVPEQVGVDVVFTFGGVRFRVWTLLSVPDPVGGSR